jgi:hypothetical protein
MFHRRAFAQGGPAALRSELGSQFLLERLVLADMQASPVPKLGVGARCAYPTRITGTRRKLHSPPWGHRHRHAPGQATIPCTQSRPKSVLAKRSPPWGQGRAMLCTPCAAHWAIRGLAI